MENYLRWLENYLRWSVNQLYLIYFLPSHFIREVVGDDNTNSVLSKTERFYYLLKILPWAAGLLILINVAIGYSCKIYGVPFRWACSWIWIGAIAFVGILIGVKSRVTDSIVFILGIGAGAWAIGITSHIGFSEKSIIILVLSLGASAGIVHGLLFSSEANKVNGFDYGIHVGWNLGTAWGLVIIILGCPISIIQSAILLGTNINLLESIVYGIVYGMLSAATFALTFWLTCFRIILYPFDVAFSIVQFLRNWPRPRTLVQERLTESLNWHEAIWLPLPFIKHHLTVLAEQDRAKGLSQIAFTVANHPLQRRAARLALVEVAINGLQIYALSEILINTNKLSWSTNSSTNFPDEIIRSLPYFDRIAQHIEQYMTLNNAYRKLEALNSALIEGEVLQRNLINSTHRYARQLLQVANSWYRLIEVEREKVNLQAKRLIEIPNPFVFGNPIKETDSNVFIGRQDIVRQIEASVLGAIHTPMLLLHGPRRMGKTSILYQLPRLLGPNFASAIVDCQNPAVTGSKTAMLRYLSQALSRGLQRRHVIIEHLTELALAHEPFSLFDDWMESVERTMPNEMRVLLCLDEYEKLAVAVKDGWGEGLLDALRHILQHRPRVVLMFVGAHTFEDMGPIWTDRFISARRVRVSFLKRSDVELLLTKPLPDFAMTYLPDALESIIATTNCQPFLSQAVAFELVQLLNEKNRKEATLEAAEVAIARALISAGEYFANMWSDASESSRLILQAIANSEPIPNSPSALTWLHEQDVINSSGQFTVPMFQQWIKKKNR